MSDTELIADSAATAEGLDDTHYRQAFGALCEEKVVSASTTIYADNGTKLLDKGARIDRALYARLVGHRLRDPIDLHIGVEGMVTADSLNAMAASQLDTATVPRLLASAVAHRKALLQPLRELPLPGPIALKLTLMRDRSPALLQHALAGLVVALFLAERLALPAAARVNLAAAALLRDIGMLHMNPAWLAPDRRMSTAERRHLHAHPVTSMLLVRTGGYAPDVATAVLEHHERLDGSGYPRALQAAQLSLPGRILLLAELVAALGEKFGDASPHRLGMVLRLNRRALPIALIALLLPALQGQALPSATQAEKAARKFAGISGAFQRWKALPADPGDAASCWVDARMADLRQSLTEAGLPPEDPELHLAYAAGDEFHLADALAVGREALWQLDSICTGALQRWPALAALAGDPAAATPLAAWCRWTGEMLADLPAPDAAAAGD